MRLENDLDVYRFLEFLHFCRGKVVDFDSDVDVYRFVTFPPLCGGKVVNFESDLKNLKSYTTDDTYGIAYTLNGRGLRHRQV